MAQQILGLSMKTAYLASLLLAAILSLVYVFQASYSSLMSFISDAFSFLLPVAAVGSAAIALRKYWRNLSDKYTQIWLYFTVGLLLWFTSRIVWDIYAMSLNSMKPYPSFADVIWLAGYVPIFAGLHLYLRSFGFSFSRFKYSAFAAAISLVLLMCFIILVPPVVAASEETVTVLLGLIYLGLDLSLLSLSVHGLFVFFNGRIGVAWAFFSSALLLNAVGDILFSYAIQNNTYYTGHPLELLFHSGYIFCTLAFYTHMKEF